MLHLKVRAASLEQATAELRRRFVLAPSPVVHENGGGTFHVALSDAYIHAVNNWFLSPVPEYPELLAYWDGITTVSRDTSAPPSLEPVTHLWATGESTADQTAQLFLTREEAMDDPIFSESVEDYLLAEDTPTYARWTLNGHSIYLCRVSAPRGLVHVGTADHTTEVA